MMMVGVALGGPMWLMAIFITCCAVQCTTQLNSNNSATEAYGLNIQEFMNDDDAQEELGRRKRYMLMDNAKLWPKGVVPFKYRKMDERNKKDIVASMAMYEYLTHLRFVDWDASLVDELGHKGFLSYVTTWGRGWSLLGFHDYRDGQSMDCPRQSTCVHELGHALGFQHEQYHPERDRWVSVKLDNIRELDSWKVLGWKDMGKTHFDYSSFMLYPPVFKEYDLQFPELFPFEQRTFYMFKELCIGYNCDQSHQCDGKQLSCANEGYVSVVDDRCSCVCLPGLDPGTSCTTIIRNGQGKWPSGLFSLLEHKDGCPDGYFKEGTVTHVSTGDNRMISPDFKGDLSGVKAQLSFCTQTADSQNGQWPPGSYCFFKKGECPGQRGVNEGKIELVGDYTNYKGNTYTGHLPDGDTGIDPSMEYCCVHTGFPYMPINLPNDKPFILLAKGGQEECQQVIGMTSKMEKLGLYSPRIFGDVLYEWDGRTAMVSYCVYTPADRQCGDIVELGPQRTSVTIESDKSNPSNRECDWLFKNAPGAKGTLVFTFDEFDVKCSEYVEVQHTMVAQKGVKFCDEIKDKSVQSLFDKLRVQYKTHSNSQSSFKATIKWVPDNELCYDASRNGATYRGSVSYTKDFEACLPWSEVKKCLKIPNSYGFYRYDLEDNKCRNPDNSYYPWCYTSLDGCKRDFCDVCQLEKPYDKAEDCDERKRRGECGIDSLDCAETCGIIKQGPSPDVRPVTCRRPGTISGGDLQGPHKASYNLGDSATYKCRKSGNTVEVSCQGDGEWSTANTACLSCPQGYFHYRDDCYKYYSDYVQFSDAKERCSSTGAVLAVPRNQGENDFMASIKYPINLVWIDATLEDKKFQTKNGDLINWFNWKHYDVPHPYRCVFMRADDYWKDTNSCDWEMNYICRIPVNDANPDCKDFIDNCPALVSVLNDSNCDLQPGLNTYCRYTCGKCPGGCHQDLQLTETNRENTITADRSKSTDRYCTWNIKAPSKNGRIVLKFEELDVQSDGDKCVDGIEVKSKIYGPPYTRFCNAHYNKTVIIKEDQMIVSFITPKPSTSHFKAHIEWIPDDDMCYNAADKGWSYDGKVNYTSTFEACLPWADVLNCENNTLWNGYFLDNLEENYCRNPRPEEDNEQPYCYTTDCVKKYCDVCHLEKKHDNSSDCQSYKTSGKCLLDPLNAAINCAETCKAELQGNKVKVSDVSCPRPTQVSDGTMVSDAQTSYKVGDRARYKCNIKDSYIERTCLSSGAWSTANSACLDCPYGFIPYKGQCYRYFPLYMDKDGANDHCFKMGGVVANPKNADQNHFIASIREGERIWLGGTKSTSDYLWNDGTRVSWLNWQLERRKFKYRDDCMVLEKSEKWTDDWCQDKLFHFVCQVKPQSESEECVDFLDICPSLVKAVPDGDCANFPSLQMDCRSSCGMCLGDCHKNIRLSSDNQIYHITSQKQELCSWSFKGDGKIGRFIVTLDQFDVNPPDSLSITLPESNTFLHKFSGGEFQKVMYVYENNLQFEFKGTANSNSNFQATIRWIKDDADMCYSVKDKGWSYVGKVSFTKAYQTCTPWAQTDYCGHSSFQIGDFMDNLDSNYCRNPDGSDQPWCYTVNCRKQTCDVCHLEKLEDVGDDCVQRKNRGECTEESTDCAKTCELDKYVKKVSSTKCGRPSQVSKGQFQGPIKNLYNVGDTVTYKCSSSSFTVSRVCLSSGEWSVADTACLGCPLDSFEYHGNCYKYIEKELNYTDAEKECQKYGSKMATPRLMNENKFIRSLSSTALNPTDYMWIGARKKEDKQFYWNDDTLVDWTNWLERKKSGKREDCVTLEPYGRWKDDWCHDKYFNFVCQQKSYDEPECKDFLDDCPYRLSLTNRQMCEPDSRLETLCRKTCGLCPKDCDHTVELSGSVPAYEINWDRRTDSRRLCTLRLSTPKNKQGRFVVQFEEFDVQDTRGGCVDMVEVRDGLHGSPNIYYCNSNIDKEMERLGHSLFIRFRTIPNSQSHIKAKVTWIDDDSMCYNTKDNGRSYHGDVNYSITFQPCLPWEQVQHCTDHPLKEGSGNLISHLHGNACRNPDNSERPWCYTRGCQKEFCDVCHLEKPYDNNDDCDSFKSQGRCSSNIVEAIKNCAATCNAVPSSQSEFMAIHVTCGTPKQVSGAVLSSPEQDTYRVGDVVTYKCPRSASVVSSMCLTSGQWSDAKTPCLSCPGGWTQFGDKCYRYIQQYLEYVDAEAECKKLSAIVSPAKSEELYKFLLSLRPDTGYIWVGAKKDEKSNQFFWSDGDPFTWTNWRFPKDVAEREKCILGDEHNKWTDDWCHDKFFPFVCQLDADDKPDCIDFMDSCSDYVQYKNNQCNAILNKYCRQSCGLCNN